MAVLMAVRALRRVEVEAAGRMYTQPNLMLQEEEMLTSKKMAIEPFSLKVRLFTIEHGKRFLT